MKTFRQLKKVLKDVPDGLPEIRVALLGDTATQLLAVALRATAVERGFRLELWEADYNQIELQICSPDSDYHRFAPDFTIIFQSTHRLLEQYNALPTSDKGTLAATRMAMIDTLVSSAEGKVIYLDYPEIGDNVFGSYGCRLHLSFIYQLRRLNVELMDYAARHPNMYICDIADIQNRLGREFMFDASIYTGTEMVLSIDALPPVAARVIDIIAAVKGRFKKCLILDLDNTLWGGVVGDDGWEGIQIGHGMGIGKAFSELQAWIKQLKERGIILAVCSKNDEEVAKEAFEKNPEMVLTLDDIAMFVANWDNKADNIRMIQKTLNIGFDSMVFLDDNPVERDIVRSNIPDITVPDLPEDPAEYLEYLYGLNLFEAAAYSEEDAARTRQYQTEARRASLQQKFTNEDDFLRSLEMTATVSSFNTFNTPRVAQLTQRSNQFNLRTVRYDEDDIRRLSSDPDVAGFAFSLKDKFGDNGLISVVILRKTAPGRLFVDTWLMSCRVLKRGMEQFVLDHIVDYARRNGFTEITGEYIPSAKNKMVADHYTSLGFEPVEGSPGQFRLLTAAYTPGNAHISLQED